MAFDDRNHFSSIWSLLDDELIDYLKKNFLIRGLILHMFVLGSRRSSNK